MTAARHSIKVNSFKTISNISLILSNAEKRNENDSTIKVLLYVGAHVRIALAPIITLIIYILHTIIEYVVAFFLVVKEAKNKIPFSLFSYEYLNEIIVKHLSSGYYDIFLNSIISLLKSLSEMLTRRGR